MIKAQDINWIDTAWRLSEALAALPDWPPIGGLLSLAPGQLEEPLPIADEHREVIDLTREEIALHLAYRIEKVHKLRVPGADKGTMFYVDSLDPIRVQDAYRQVRLAGVRLTKDDWHAVKAQVMLTNVLIDKFVCPEWKRVLPLEVASIAGKTRTQRAIESAAQPRPRPLKRLQTELVEELRRDRSQTWKQVLINLENDGCVTSWDATEIQWLNDKDEPETTAITTFQGWKSELILGIAR